MVIVISSLTFVAFIFINKCETENVKINKLKLITAFLASNLEM